MKWLNLTYFECLSSFMSFKQISFTYMSHFMAGPHKSESNLGEGPSVARFLYHRFQ